MAAGRLQSLSRLCHRLNSVTIGAKSLQSTVYRNDQIPKASSVLSLFNNTENTPVLVSHTRHLSSNISSVANRKFKDDICFQSVIVSHAKGSMLPSYEYTCPSQTPVDKVILDIDYISPRYYDCPTDISLDIDKNLPTVKNETIHEKSISDSLEKPAMYASNVLKIRHKKLKRHQFIKYRKRNARELTKKKVLKRKEKEERLTKELEAIVAKAHNFDALEHIKEEVRNAKSHGFAVDITRKITHRKRK